MTEQELQKLVEAISLEYFKRPFLHQVKINRRMRTTGGRYHLSDHHLEINAHFLAPQYRKELIGVIKHELTHYHLHLTMRGYRHRDSDFKVLLARVGGSRYAPDIGLQRKKTPNYVYSCQKCDRTFYRVHRLNLQQYVCGNCGGRLKLVSMSKK